MLRFPIPRRGKGGREYDDLQNWLDMTSHKNPLLEPNVAAREIATTTTRNRTLRVGNTSMLSRNWSIILSMLI